MTGTLTAAERDTLVDRIAARIAEYDDAALLELDRVTDEASYLAGELTVGLPDGAEDPPPSLSRRQLVAGGALLTLASLGTAMAVRGALPTLWCP